jgi:rhodanese-related sulfurtransferase
MKKTNGRHHSKQNRRWLWIGSVLGAAIIALIAGIILLGGNEDETEKENTSSILSSEISVQEAVTMRDQGAFILDVREPEEWAKYHIPGATLIPLGELQNRLSEIPRDQPIVVVCRSGNRSAQGRDILLLSDYDQVASIAGVCLSGALRDYQSRQDPKNCYC